MLTVERCVTGGNRLSHRFWYRSAAATAGSAAVTRGREFRAQGRRFVEPENQAAADRIGLDENHPDRVSKREDALGTAAYQPMPPGIVVVIVGRQRRDR